MNPPRSSTATLIAALYILCLDIESYDGVANAAITEAAERLEELRNLVEDCKEFVQDQKVLIRAKYVMHGHGVARVTSIDSLVNRVDAELAS